jgi:regulation of enolase protein 1 (concanavalin A-like superfamily)
MRGRSFLLTSHRLSGQVLLGVFVALALTIPAYAVKNVKVSTYGNGHQIWFEAEDFDERNPNTPDYSPVVDQDGAFGKAVGRTGAAGGMMRWAFDISAAGGKGGTWYFWGRVLNPNNRSDYMLIEGDPQGPPIPTGPTFPAGDGTAPFTNARDRIFEATVSAWGWARSGHPEGHTKQLQNGVNNMYIFRREGTNATVFWDVFMWTDDPAYTPTDDDYRNAAAPVAGIASDPLPGTGVTDVPRDVVLSWTVGDFASKHDVYFGTDLAAVTQATTTADPGGVYQGRVDSATYAVPLLAYGQTYYWRVDEVNAPPTSTVITGNVWSFTTETLTSQVTAVTATASSFEEGFGPENTVNGSGLSNGLHSAANADSWVSAKGGAQPTWIQFAFDRVYKLAEMRVWNYNIFFEPVLGFGFKDVTIEYSTDGTTWTLLKEDQFAQAAGQDNSPVSTTVDLGGVGAQFVRLTAQSNWGGIVQQFGLSEVQFSYTPVSPREPVPASGAQGVDENTVLSWRAGREAASHQVYFGTDANAVRSGTAPVHTVADHRFDPGPLEFGQTYYWKVAEVNEAATPAIWEGDLWSFSTREALVVDDFESYTDDEGSRIYEAWVDGWTNGTGSTVGYVQAPFAERAIVHGGQQSMPLDYNNTKSPFYSEAERTFDTVQDWTVNGADTLTLYFRGNPAAFVESAGTTTMSGGGTDIWNTADQFRFASKQLNGDGTLVAKVESVGNTDPWAKAGVMIRESTDPGSRFAAVYATPGNGVRYQARMLNAAAATSDTSVATTEQMALKTPVWIKVERKGSSFSCFYSTDGANWTTMSWNPQTINMPAGAVCIGLAVTSHNATATTTAVFSNISTTGNVTGAWQVQAIGVAQPANDAAPLYVVVQDSAGKNKVITHPDPAATTLDTWQTWRIPLSDLSGVKLTAVKKMYIGVGDRSNPKADGAGKIFIDDIGVGHPASAN